MWTPLPHEADLFCNVYIDESSQTGHRYFVLGGLVVPLSHAAQFETDIIAARDDVIAIANPDGTPPIIGVDAPMRQEFLPLRPSRSRQAGSRPR